MLHLPKITKMKKNKQNETSAVA